MEPAASEGLEELVSVDTKFAAVWYFGAFRARGRASPGTGGRDYVLENQLRTKLGMKPKEKVKKTRHQSEAAQFLIASDSQFGKWSKSEPTSEKYINKRVLRALFDLHGIDITTEKIFYKEVTNFIPDICELYKLQIEREAPKLPNTHTLIVKDVCIAFRTQSVPIRGHSTELFSRKFPDRVIGMALLGVTQISLELSTPKGMASIFPIATNVPSGTISDLGRTTRCDVAARRIKDCSISKWQITSPVAGHLIADVDNLMLATVHFEKPTYLTLEVQADYEHFWPQWAWAASIQQREEQSKGDQNFAVAESLMLAEPNTKRLLLSQILKREIAFGQRLVVSSARRAIP